MHFTSRLRDPHRTGLIVALYGLAASAAVMACSSSEEPSGAPLSDAGVISADAPDEASAEADASVHDAGTFDGKPRPVVCESSPCATALVTTLGRSIDDKGEGFCVLLDDGTVACWGANGAGQLGRGEGPDERLVDSSTAQKVVNLSNVVSLDHTCAVDEAGGVWCWGTGPLSWSEDGGVAQATHPTPVKLELPPVTKVARSYATACALVAGEVRCWGSNALGQLGPLTETFSGEPERIALPEGVAPAALELGGATFVLREDGSIVSWGANPGIGRVSPSFPDPRPQDVPLERVTQIDSAYDNTCAVANGIGHCWGARVTPFKGNEIDRALPEPVAAPERIVQIATTRSEGYVLPQDTKLRDFKPYRWCAVGDSGSLYCWGFNESGQAGTGTKEHVTRAAWVSGLPEKALVAQVKTTVGATCALLTTGKVYCWGSNSSGQLGNGLSRGESLSPTEVVLP